MKETFDYEKYQQLRAESKKLMEIADSFAEKGDKGQAKKFLILSSKKAREAGRLLFEDMGNLVKEIMK